MRDPQNPTLRSLEVIYIQSYRTTIKRKKTDSGFRGLDYVQKYKGFRVGSTKKSSIQRQDRHLRRVGHVHAGKLVSPPHRLRVMTEAAATSLHLPPRLADPSWAH